MERTTAVFSPKYRAKNELVFNYDSPTISFDFVLFAIHFWGHVALREILLLIQLYLLWRTKLT